MRIFKSLFTILTIALISLQPAAVSGFSETTEGSWVGKMRGDTVKIQFTMFSDTDSWGQWSTTKYFQKKMLEGIQTGREHVFKLVRDAGTILFDGKFSGERGAGNFQFEADEKFKEFLQGKGFSKITDRNLLLLSINNVNKKS